MDAFRPKSFLATCLVVGDLTRPVKIVQMSCAWARVYIKDNPPVEIVSPREYSDCLNKEESLEKIPAQQHSYFCGNDYSEESDTIHQLISNFSERS